MAKTEDRGGTGRNWDVCIFRDQINTEFISVLERWLEEGFITGYVVSPEHNKDTYNSIDEEMNSTKKAGEIKPPHRHIAVSFSEPMNTEQTKHVFKPLYSELGWQEQLLKEENGFLDFPMYLYFVRGRLNYYLHWEQPEKRLYDTKDMVMRGFIQEDKSDNIVIEEGTLVKKFNANEINNKFIVVFGQDPKVVMALEHHVGGLASLRKMCELFKWKIEIEDKPVTEQDYDEEIECVNQKGLRAIVHTQSPTTVSAVERGFSWAKSFYKNGEKVMKYVGLPPNYLDSVSVCTSKDTEFEKCFVTKQYSKDKRKEIEKVEGELNNEWELEL